ncbi:MAG TPA: AMP-binding protein, partial [Xanthomonadales bacterium]|nr:AMP-binding protein [Xanthomonadales bacterium]
AIGSALAARGVEPGDRVAAALAPGAAWVAALIGVSSIRAAFAPVPEIADEPSARAALRGAGARVLLASASAALPAGLRAAAAALAVPVVRLGFDERGVALVDGDHVYDAHARIAEPEDVAFVPLEGEPRTHADLVAATGDRGLAGLLDAVAASEALSRAA